MVLDLGPDGVDVESLGMDSGFDWSQASRWWQPDGVDIVLGPSDGADGGNDGVVVESLDYVFDRWRDSAVGDVISPHTADPNDPNTHVTLIFRVIPHTGVLPTC